MRVVLGTNTRVATSVAAEANKRLSPCKSCTINSLAGILATQTVPMCCIYVRVLLVV